MSTAPAKNLSSAGHETSQTQTTAVIQFTPDQIEDARRFLADNLDPADLNPSKLAPDGRDKIIESLRQAVSSGSIQNAPQNPQPFWIRALYNNTVGLGVVEEFLADPSIEQINIQGPQKIILQIKGVWTEVNDPEKLFRDVKELRTVASNLAHRIGKKLSKHTNPIIDVRFGKPVLQVHINQTRRDHGLAIYIRRGRSEPFTTDFLIESGTFNRKVLAILQNAAERLIGCVFLGDTGAGKTVMLEKYIDWLPHVPVVVVDGTGDCQPSHPMCAIFDLPETSYNPNHQSNLTLGGMTQAAFREGDVLCVAETRGSEEAGALLADAPSKNCVITTAHGASAELGLSRLVAIAQRPPSPYAGSHSPDALRDDVSNAFPLVVHVKRRGDRRFVNGIYHNMGWDNEKGDWNLRPIVITNIYDERGVKWDVIDDDLDKIKAATSIEVVQVPPTVHEPRDPQHILTEALHKMDEEEWEEAIDDLSSIVKNDPYNQIARQRLVESIEHTDDYKHVVAAAKEEAVRLDRLVKQRLWKDARNLLKELPNRPEVYATLWHLQRGFSKTQRRIDDGYNETNEAVRIVQEGRKLMRSTLPWTDLRRCLSVLQSLDTDRLSDETKTGIKFTHANLLIELVKRAPMANSQFYRQKLEAFIGKEEARRRLVSKSS